MSFLPYLKPSGPTEAPGYDADERQVAWKAEVDHTDSRGTWVRVQRLAEGLDDDGLVGPLDAGELPDGTEVAVVLDDDSDPWLLLPVVAGVPTGALLPYAGTVAPHGYLVADGTAVSRTLYPRLFSLIGSAYGPGDGSTTFNLPSPAGPLTYLIKI